MDLVLTEHRRVETIYFLMTEDNLSLQLKQPWIKIGTYTAGGTGLTACFPPWTAADGKLFDNLADPAIRARIRAEMAQAETDWENMGQLAGPENILIVAVNRPENRQFAGKRLNEIATMQNKDWRDAAMDLVLTEHRRVETIYFLMSADNLALQLKQPWIKIGTDSEGMNPEN